ncbi:MAG: alpha/beta fold hydrolase [Thermoplasmata archaeon]
MGEYLDVNGVRTYFETRGKGEPVLLLHGGGGTVESLYAQADELSKFYSVVLPERRWHGRSACVGTELTYEIMTADTIALLDALKARKAHLIGHSDGANVAAMIALKRPELVRKLVMISGNFNSDYMSAEGRASLGRLTVIGLREIFPAVVDMYYKVVPNADERFPILLEMLKKLWTSDWRISSEDLGRIGARTLVMSADRDMIPLAHTLELFRSIPPAQLCVIPNANHLLVMESPEAVNRAILCFLEP